MIPGCMATAVYGIESCSCHKAEELLKRVMGYAEFERKIYNETVKELRQENEELKKYVFQLQRLIKRLNKTGKIQYECPNDQIGELTEMVDDSDIPVKELKNVRRKKNELDSRK